MAPLVHQIKSHYITYMNLYSAWGWTAIAIFCDTNNVFFNRMNFLKLKTICSAVTVFDAPAWLSLSGAGPHVILHLGATVTYHGSKATPLKGHQHSLHAQPRGRLPAEILRPKWKSYIYFWMVSCNNNKNNNGFQPHTKQNTHAHKRERERWGRRREKVCLRLTQLTYSPIAKEITHI